MTALTDEQKRVYLKIAAKAVKKGGKVLLDYWGKNLSIKAKRYSGDLVKEASLKSERAIISSLKEDCQQLSLIALDSEAGNSHAVECSWLVNPLDGALNFTHAYPVYSISIALVYRERPVVAVVYNPQMGEIYQAMEGLGATCNKRSLKVSKEADLQKSLLATDFAYDRTLTVDNNYAEFNHFSNLSNALRNSGSTALDLAYVASGSLDAYWGRGLKIWDVAAGVLLVQEAGGYVTSYDSSPYVIDIDIEDGRARKILATNGRIHSRMSEQLMRLDSFRVQLT